MALRLVLRIIFRYQAYQISIVIGETEIAVGNFEMTVVGAVAVAKSQKLVWAVEQGLCHQLAVMEVHLPAAALVAE